MPFNKVPNELEDYKSICSTVTVSFENGLFLFSAHFKIKILNKILNWMQIF